MCFMQQQDHALLASRLADAYELYADDIFRFCRNKVKSNEEAEDLMQESFLRTCQYLQSGKTVEDLKTFLYRVAEHLVIDGFRKKKSLSLNELLEQGFDPGHETVDTMHQSLDVQKFLLTAEKKNEYRLLVMRYVDGLRPVDIALQTGLAPNTVAVRIHRAIQKLTKRVIQKKSAAQTKQQ